MVSLVIVSHSAKLADGIYELVNQMSQGKTKIALAAGIDDIENPIGTDAIAVMNAVESVYDDSGVLIMVDMGSAILSAEMAIELLDPEIAKNTRICAAPVLEGSISASVAACAGLDLDSVEREAHNSLEPKYKSLNQEQLLFTVRQGEGQPSNEGEAIEFSWTVKNEHGIHARPSAAVVNILSNYESDVEIILGDQKASGKSLNGIAALGVRMNDTIIARAVGPDARELIEQFEVLAKSNFGESLDSNVTAEFESVELFSGEENNFSIKGVSVCKGIALGKVAVFNQTMPDAIERESFGEEDEIRNFEQSVKDVENRLRELISATGSGEEQQSIFEAHIMMLYDDDFQKEVIRHIHSGINADLAVIMAVSDLALSFRNSGSDYMKAREADVWDIGRQLVYELIGQDNTFHFNLEEPIVLIANELSPSNMARVNDGIVKAICLNGGDPCSHSAVIARAKGIPTIFNLDANLELFLEGTSACVDAFAGRVWYNPGPKHYDNLANHYSRYL